MMGKDRKVVLKCHQSLSIAAKLHSRQASAAMTQSFNHQLSITKPPRKSRNVAFRA